MLLICTVSDVVSHGRYLEQYMPDLRRRQYVPDPKRIPNLNDYTNEQANEWIDRQVRVSLSECITE